jgi:hypothetical protein
LYALGCVLYEILGGRPPFTADEPLALVVQHIADDPIPLDRLREDVPAELCDLVSRLLAKRPEDRPANAAEVREILAPWAEQAVPKAARAAAPGPGTTTMGVPRGGAGLPGKPFPGQEHAPSPEQTPAPPQPRRSPSPSGTGSPAPADSGDLRVRARGLAAEGRFSQALELLSRDLDAVLPRFGPSDPEIVSRRLGILRLQFEAQELQAVRDGCLELADTLASARSVPDADLAACRVMAARCLGRLGHNSDALRELREALDLQKTVLSPLHPEVLETRREIATLLAGSGSPGEALKALRSLADDQRTALPPDHPAHAEVERLISRLSRLIRTLPLPR